MSPSAPDAAAGLRAIAFASPDGSAWGAALSNGERCALRLEPDDDGPPERALLVTDTPDGGWRLERDAGPDGASVSLRVVPDEPPAPAAAEPADPDTEPPPGAAFVPGEGPELCRVTGTVAGRPLQWRGIRVSLPPSRPSRKAPGSTRFVAGWLADGSALGLIAARPRPDGRPDEDTVRATLFDPERWLAVSEPRLSTTYDGAGLPTRLNLELWIGTGEHEFPRRAAAEAAGAPSAGGDLQVVPLRCHSRGEEGVGLYVLASF
ncbi:MAG TPA: hypothetical protein VKV21_07220 [Solirubrobacteraceae bacterium]|nr:hypothetical protein [Solirubrobacteraceae bacterium]